MIHILRAEDILRRVYMAALMLSLNRDNYAETVFTLRNIRESQKLSQEEIAEQLNVSQSKISRFELLYPDVSLEFFLSYANALGCNIIVCKTDDDANLLPPSSAVSVQEKRKQIILKLLEAKDNCEKSTLIKLKAYVPEDVKDDLTVKLISEELQISENVVKRLETDDSYIPDARVVFCYASYLGMALRLSEDSLTVKKRKSSEFNIDKYLKFIFILRKIRESYQITQNEMAILMGVDQSAISKFEFAKLDVKLDFLILYASLLGYNIRVGSVERSRGELYWFHRRQSWMAKALSYIERWQLYYMFYSGLHRKEKWPKDSIIDEYKKRIISELLDAKHKKGLTTKKLSEELGVSDRTIRRFEREKNYVPSASSVFKYAALVNAELQLEKNLRCKPVMVTNNGKRNRRCNPSNIGRGYSGRL